MTDVQTAATASNFGFMVKQTLSELVNNERKAIGTYEHYLPSLRDFGIIDEKAEVVYEGEGDNKVPVGFKYSTDALNYLGKALEAAAKATARNKLVPKTANVRPGAKLPETFAELIAPGEGRGGSAVLAERSALFKAWESFVMGLDKNDTVKRLLVLFVKQPDALLTQPEKVRKATEDLLVTFATAQAEKGALTDWQANHLNVVASNCSADVEGADW